MNATRRLFVILLAVLTAGGCASKAKKQGQIRRAYAAGEQAARAQMQQGQEQQQTPPPIDQNGDPQIRIMGFVKNKGWFRPVGAKVLSWEGIVFLFARWPWALFGETAAVVESSASQLTVEADLPQPAILLITDAYSSGWQARPLNGSVQQVYKVLPANYVLQAIPLSQGHHRIRLEYLPRGVHAGMWISIAATVGLVFATGHHARKNCFRRVK